MNNIKQGNDTRQNCQKPNSVLTEIDKKGDNIIVYIGEDNKSGVYYKGKAKGYFNGAVRDDTKPDHFMVDEGETPETNTAKNKKK
jgi:hypothetical protein